MTDKFKELKQLYSRDEFWSKTCHKLYPKFSIFGNTSINLSKTLTKFLKECEDVEKKYGYVVRTTQERTRHFFIRFLHALKMKNEITQEELDEFMSFVREDKATSTRNIPQKTLAQQLILKAILEIGQKQKKESLTVYHLLSLPTFQPLPKSLSLPNNQFEFQKENNEREKFRRSPDFHIIVMNREAAWRYTEAIQLLSLKYLDIAVAFDEISKKTELKDYEKDFVDSYLEVNSVPYEIIFRP